MDKKILEARNIHQSFGKGRVKVDVLKDVNLEINSGEVVALMAPSGAGKSTLLHVLGLLEKPVSGEVLIDNHRTSKLKDGKKTKIRANNIGFVFQDPHLQPEFNALENIMLPQLMMGKSKKKSKKKALKLLEQIGLTDREKHRPSELSGGEQQRVAIARALSNSPKILFADEPTGNLDKKTAKEIFELLLLTVKERNMACLFVTHNELLSKKADRVIKLEKINN